MYEQGEPASIARKTMKRLLNMAFTQIYFNCNETRYVQKGDLAVGTSRAIVLSNLWLKLYGTALLRDTPELCMPEKDLNGI